MSTFSHEETLHTSTNLDLPLTPLEQAIRAYDRQKNVFTGSKITTSEGIFSEVQATVINAVVHAFTHIPDPDMIKPLEHINAIRPGGESFKVSLADLGLLSDISIDQTTGGELNVKVKIQLTTIACPKREYIRKGVEKTVTEILKNKDVAVGEISGYFQVHAFCDRAFRPDTDRAEKLKENYDNALDGTLAIQIVEAAKAEAVEKGYMPAGGVNLYNAQMLNYHPGCIPLSSRDKLKQIFAIASQHPEIQNELTAVTHLEETVRLLDLYTEALNDSGNFEHPQGTAKHAYEAQSWYKQNRKQ